MLFAEHKAHGLENILEDDTEEANIARLHFDPTRQLVLEQLDWGFARARFQGVKVNTTSVGTPHLTVALQRPPNTLRVRQVTRCDHPVEFLSENVIWVADDAETLVHITRDEREISLFPPIARTAMVYHLAHHFVLAFSRSLNRSNQMLDNFYRTMAMAEETEALGRFNGPAYGGSTDQAAHDYVTWGYR
ncbi:MAG: hypothetical protein AAFU34_15560 [Pseudomonadota bacterium]